MAKNAVIHAQQRWEYLSVVKRTEAALAQEMNDLGQIGWELVSVSYGKDRKGELSWTGFLKRPASQQPQTTSAGKHEAGASPQPSPEAGRVELPAPSEGFDLSGEEFALKKEQPDASKSEPAPDGSKT